VSGVEQPPSRECVLVVDDEASVRSLVRTILSRAGFAVAEAEDGQEAWSLLKKQQDGEVDLVVTDIQMNGMDGLALTERCLREYPHVRVLLMSGYMDITTVNLESDGRWLFLSKPFSPQALLAAIQTLRQAQLRCQSASS